MPAHDLLALHFLMMRMVGHGGNNSTWTYTKFNKLVISWLRCMKIQHYRIRTRKRHTLETTALLHLKKPDEQPLLNMVCHQLEALEQKAKESSAIEMNTVMRMRTVRIGLSTDETDLP